MSFTEARYINGSSFHAKCETVGGLMVHFANLHQRFASDIAVVCPDSGRDLTNSPSQAPPSVVQVVVKPENVNNPAKENLVLAFDLHAKSVDTATCARAYKLLLNLYDWDRKNYNLLEMLDEVAGGDIDTEARFLRDFIHAGIDLHFALQDACISGNENRVKILLSLGVPLEGDCGEAKLGRDCEKYQPLCAAAGWGHAGVVELLIAQRASVDCSCVIERTFGRPLVFASMAGHADVVRMLLNHRAQVDHVYCGGCSDWALAVACELAEINVVDILLSHRADPNLMAGNSSALMKAISSGHIGTIQLLLERKANVNQECESGKTALQDALMHCDRRPHVAKPDTVVKLLIDYRAQVNGNSSGTLFLICTGDGDSDVRIAKLLLDNKANVNEATCTGMTPLMRATKFGCIEMVNTLLKNKACVNLRDEHGNTALTLALEKNNAPLVEILQHHSVITSPTFTEKGLVDQSKRESESCSSTSVSKKRIADESKLENGASSESYAKKRRMEEKCEAIVKAHFVCEDDVLRQKKRNRAMHVPAGTRTKEPKKMKVTRVATAVLQRKMMIHGE